MRRRKDCADEGENGTWMKYQNALRVRSSRSVDLTAIDPCGTGGFPDKETAGQKLERDIARLCDVQSIFAAAGSHALLVVFQGMDTAGKDGAVSHVMSGMNPQGVQVTGFKQPSPEELRHDYLWRCAKSMPER